MKWLGQVNVIGLLRLILCGVLLPEGCIVFNAVWGLNWCKCVIIRRNSCAALISELHIRSIPTCYNMRWGCDLGLLHFVSCGKLIFLGCWLGCGVIFTSNCKQNCIQYCFYDTVFNTLFCQGARLFWIQCRNFCIADITFRRRIPWNLLLLSAQ
jgi:hypothetical protein